MPYRICKAIEVENGHMLSKHPDKCRFPHGSIMKTRKSKASLILDAINKGVEKAAERHRRMGAPMVIRKDGKTVLVMPQKRPMPSRSGK